MRKIQFRGRQIGNGKWYYGSYLYLNVPARDWTGKARGNPEPVHYIIDEKDVNYAVDPNTVGQYTGLTDKNSKKIFEGDIVRCVRTGCDGEVMVGHIVFDDCCYSVKERKTPNQPAMDLCDDFEVIGNIHDNPELLEVK